MIKMFQWVRCKTTFCRFCFSPWVGGGEPTANRWLKKVNKKYLIFSPYNIMILLNILHRYLLLLDSIRQCEGVAKLLQNCSGEALLSAAYEAEFWLLAQARTWQWSQPGGTRWRPGRFPWRTPPARSLRWPPYITDLTLTQTCKQWLTICSDNTQNRHLLQPYNAQWLSDFRNL